MAGHQENEKDAALAAVEPASEYDQAGSDQYEVFKKDVGKLMFAYMFYF